MKSFLSYLYVSIFITLTLGGCSQESKQINHLDGEALLESKCASCHNLAMPPETSPDELAPPMMAVAFHVYDFIKVGTPAEKIPASIAFVKDYVVAPTREKSFCDEKSLNDYGVMPSQKENLSADELESIAIYMFDHYNQENFLKIMKERQVLNDMHPGERMALKYGCLSCHGLTHKKMGPAFSDISKQYENNEKQIETSIQNGSQNRWLSSHHARMPSFKQLNTKELVTLSHWIMEQ